MTFAIMNALIMGSLKVLSIVKDCTDPVIQIIKLV